MITPRGKYLLKIKNTDTTTTRMKVVLLPLPLERSFPIGKKMECYGKPLLPEKYGS